jgi:hypothetical protein
MKIGNEVTVEEKIEVLGNALINLRKIRDNLRYIGNKQAIKALRRAIKSVEGAERHVICREARRINQENIRREEAYAIFKEIASHESFPAT